MFAGFELFTSSVYDVLDRYVEMYGWDAVIPVARTDIGNLCASPCVNDPELYRCMTLKGAEFIVRTATGGVPRWAPDMPVWCRVNRVYGGIVNNSISPDNPHFLESGDNGTVLKPGGSAIFGPDGNTVADTLSQNEDSVVSSIPMASFRKTHRLPTCSCRCTGTSTTRSPRASSRVATRRASRTRSRRRTRCGSRR